MQAQKDRVVDRRTRKRIATRQTISDVATRLFFARGFDGVTIDEIAEAADVGRMTVFNHFPRKEDMIFDREDEARHLVLDAVRSRSPGVSPLRALHLLAHRLITENSPAVRFFDGSRQFVETVTASEALKARARAIRDDVAGALTSVLAEAVDRRPDDPNAQLASNLFLATWATAFAQAHDVYRQDGNVDAAKERFLEVVDRGAAGIVTAMAGTPYAA
jgi:AcrR family transcriptional regulator